MLANPFLITKHVTMSVYSKYRRIVSFITQPFSQYRWFFASSESDCSTNLTVLRYEREGVVQVVLHCFRKSDKHLGHCEVMRAVFVRDVCVVFVWYLCGVCEVFVRCL